MENTKINPETGTKYSCAELKAAWARVATRDNWNRPILEWIDSAEDDVSREAIIFFARRLGSLKRENL
jgi:hypothetical protein